MKICQICRLRYQDDQSFCFNDGSVLVNLENELSEATLNIPPDKIPYLPIEQNNLATAMQNGVTNPNSPPNVRKPKSLVLLGVIAALILLPIVAIGFGIIYLGIKGSRQTNIESVTPTPISKTPTPVRKAKPEANLQVEIQDKVKGSFGRKYLRCMVTNIGEGVVENPRISLLLYKNDIKIGNVYGDSKLDFLKPNQTIPVWVDISNSEYTSAQFDKSPFAKVSEKDEKSLYPTLIYTDTKLTSQTLTSSYNFRNYPEVFYKVKGIVTNTDYDKVSPKIYVFFYDENKQIVGIDSTYPPELKRGEKAEFEVEVGETSIFGKPKEFEIFAVTK